MKKKIFNLKRNVNDKKEFFLSIKKIFPFLFLLLFVPANFQFAEENVISIQGKDGAPFFDRRGNLNIVHITSDGRIGLSTQQGGKFRGADIQNIHYTDNISSICAKKDKLGRIWLVWEEKGSERSDIYIAQLRNNKIVNPTALTDNMRGFNFSPNINFSIENDLFMAWVNYYQKKYTIVVKNVRTNQCWHINSYSALDPQLIIDETGKIWLFWVGQLRNCDEILYTTFDGVKWKEPSSLNQYPDVPHITPSIALDFYGFPHVVWSSYDGDDYELYYSYWDGNKWHKEKRITNNQDIADNSPSISLLFDAIPLVTWSRYINGKREVCATYKNGNGWSAPLNISEDKNITDPPQLVSFMDKIGISWQVEKEIKVILLDFQELQLFLPGQNEKDGLPRIMALDDDKYIGFGDSITYGIISHQAAPNRGYVPRLEKLIDSNIKNSTVLNKGVGGENTSEGRSRINGVIKSAEAKTIFLMEGTNDVKNTRISMDTASFNLRQMANTCLNYNMTVFLSTIIDTPGDDEVQKARIRSLNSKIKSIAASPKIHFVDNFKAFTDHSGNLYSDSTHPNDAGYQLIAATWYKKLKDILPSITPSIEVDKNSLAFEGTQALTLEKPSPKANPNSQQFRVRNSGNGTLNYSITDNKTWLSTSPTSGSSTGEWDDIAVSVNIAGLAGGTHTGSITITSGDASNSPQVISVDLTILTPIIELDKTSLSFKGLVEEADPPAQEFKIKNSGVGTLNYSAEVNKEWLSVSPPTGDSTGEWDDIEVSVNIAGLAGGTHTSSITITSGDASNSPQVINVDLNILTPIIELDKTSLSFEAVVGEADPPAQEFKIKNSGAGTLNYSAEVNKEWLSVSPPTGDSTGEWDKIKVSIDMSLGNLVDGNNKGTITINDENASNSPQKITVNFLLELPPLYQPKSFIGEKKANRSLSQIEYINVLSWVVNPDNADIIEKYRIYRRETNGITLITEVDAQTFEYWERNVEKDKVYKYGLTAVDVFGRETNPIYIDVF